MSAGIYNMKCDQGATLKRTITLQDDNEDPINLTNYTILMQVRNDVGEALILEASTANGRITKPSPAAGQLLLEVPAEVTRLITNSGIYEMRITNTITGEVQPVLKGDFILVPSVID